MKENIKKYLNNEIDIETLVHYFEKNKYTKEEIKKEGIVYTPKKISDYIVKLLNPSIQETIFEPSVGHGIFIFSLLEFIQNKYNLSPYELKKYLIKNVFMQDVQEKTILELKEIIIYFFKKLNISLSKEELNNIYIGNTLSNEKKSYDIIFGNPPYVNIRVIKPETLKYLRKKYLFCKKGNIDLYYAFIEYAMIHSERASFITPNSWLYNISERDLRKGIKPHLLKLIDFKQQKIFKNAATYVSIFLFDKTISSNNIEYSENIEEYYTKIDKEDLEDKRWSFYKKQISPYLNSIKYHTPIATLRDKIFVTSGINNKDFIDFYKISKIKNIEEFKKSKQQILFPYKLENNKYIIKEKEELSKESYDYLLDNKKELMKRDKGKADKYPKWYSYGRKQGLNSYQNDTYLIIIPGMIKKNFKFFKIHSKEIKKPFLFSSGFILEVEEKESEILINYLNSVEFKECMVNNGKVWKGKEEDNSYYSLSIKQLKELFSNR